MTKGNDTPALPLAKAKQRQYKVRETYHSYQLKQTSQQRTPIGEIHLKGHWLIQAGFEIDTPVMVRVMEGCLVLTTRSE
ncbi:MAG: type I toxin-antitoxin system SymE family toxin [Gammaproteobacteria bacterium]|nr:type I toxin-antitoxin system SymE family toxin [Gammaproteobacteria bacterium]